MQNDIAITCRRRADACLVRSKEKVLTETKAGWVELAAAWVLLAESVATADGIDLHIDTPGRRAV